MISCPNCDEELSHSEQICPICGDAPNLTASIEVDVLRGNITQEYALEIMALRNGMKNALEIVSVLYMDALDNNGEVSPRARAWSEKWGKIDL
jgi:hypothetical protein